MSAYLIVSTVTLKRLVLLIDVLLKPASKTETYETCEQAQAEA